MNEYDLARRIKNKSVFVPEIAVVAGVNPLVIQMGNATYSAAQWKIYEPVCDWMQLELKETHISGRDSDGGAIHVNNVATAGKGSAKVAYAVGDLLAVQQVESENAFIILSKVRRVV